MPRVEIPDPKPAAAMPPADAAAGSSSGQQQRAAANWLVTISSCYHDQLLARCWEMIAPAAREAGGGKNKAASHAGDCEVHVTDGGGRRSKSSRLMVTRGQFIELLKGVPAMPQQIIEGWFDALALRFAHVPPPPAEFTLDLRRLLAAAGTALLPHLHCHRALCAATPLLALVAALSCRVLSSPARKGGGGGGAGRKRDRGAREGDEGVV